MHVRRYVRTSEIRNIKFTSRRAFDLLFAAENFAHNLSYVISVNFYSPPSPLSPALGSLRYSRETARRLFVPQVGLPAKYATFLQLHLPARGRQGSYVNAPYVNVIIRDVDNIKMTQLYP